MIPSLENLCDNDFILQHDLAPSHRLLSTKNWPGPNAINILLRVFFFARYDLNRDNPIEDLFETMHKRLQHIAKTKVNFFPALSRYKHIVIRNLPVAALAKRDRVVTKCIGKRY